MTSLRRPAEDRWLASGRGFLGAAWYWPRGARVLPTAVLIVPGIAHEERTTSVGVSALAEALADEGLPALTITLHGTSQSTGALGVDDIGEQWRNDIRCALHYLRDNGFTRVIVVGVRLGALLAFDALAGEALLGIVAWAPIVSGRRHVRELRLLEAARPDTPDDEREYLPIAGFQIPRAVLDHLATLDLATLARIAPGPLLLLDAASRLGGKWLDRFTDQGVQIDRQESHQVDDWLFGDVERPPLPLADIHTVMRWCAQRHADTAETAGDAPVMPPALDTITFEHAGRPVRETFVPLGPLGLSAVLSEPATPPRRAAVRVLMSTVGPGRSFIDFARDEAALGRISVRFDFSGFGTSPARRHPPGAALYTDDGRDDVVDVVRHLRGIGYAKLVLLGFCAGAWSMLQAGPCLEVLGAAAINVALYRQPDAVDGVGRWLAPLGRTRWLKRFGARFDHASNARRPPIAWLDAHCRADIDVLLAYADDDPGLAYLNRQLDRGLRGQLERGRLVLRIYEGLGHLVEGAPARTRMMEDVSAFFAEIDRRIETAAATVVTHGSR